MNIGLKEIMILQVQQVPYLLVLIFGLVMSLAGPWRGRFALFAAAGFSVFILGIVLGVYQQYALATGIRESGYASAMMSNLFLRGAHIAIRVVGFGLLIAAIFAGRTEPRPARGPFNAS